MATLYEELRPRYPSALFDELIALADVRPGARVLEVGAGSGRASLPLLARGLRLVAVEPSPKLASILRAAIPIDASAEIIETPFESAPLPANSFDLAVVAQAYHWLDPAVRLQCFANALSPEGALAIFGNAPRRETGGVHDAIATAYATHWIGPSPLDGPRRWYQNRENPFVEEIRASDQFCEPSVRQYEFSTVYGSAQYCDLLRTHSDHRAQDPASLESLLSQIRSAIDAFGGALEVAYRCSLFVAGRSA